MRKSFYYKKHLIFYLKNEFYVVYEYSFGSIAARAVVIGPDYIERCIICHITTNNIDVNRVTAFFTEGTEFVKDTFVNWYMDAKKTQNDLSKL